MQLTHADVRDETEAQTALELIVDEHGLESVMIMLSDICDEKAHHIRESYNDAALAHAWKKDADKIRKFPILSQGGSGNTGAEKSRRG